MLLLFMKYFDHLFVNYNRACKIFWPGICNRLVLARVRVGIFMEKDLLRILSVEALLARAKCGWGNMCPFILWFQACGCRVHPDDASVQSGADKY
jgi:hypothetical protein